MSKDAKVTIGDFEVSIRRVEKPKDQEPRAFRIRPYNGRPWPGLAKGGIGWGPDLKNETLTKMGYTENTPFEIWVVPL